MNLREIKSFTLTEFDEKCDMAIEEGYEIKWETFNKNGGQYQYYVLAIKPRQVE